MFVISFFISSSFYFFSLIPFPFYCGSLWRSSINWVGVDNGNIGFLLLIAILFPLIYWIARIESKTMNFTLLFLLLFFLLVISFLLLSLLLFFIFYECLIILLFFILFLFLPSFYRIRTTFIFFIFTIFGTISFILSLMIFILSEWWISSLMILIPFCVKILLHQNNSSLVINSISLIQYNSKKNNKNDKVIFYSK